MFKMSRYTHDNASFIDDALFELRNRARHRVTASVASVHRRPELSFARPAAAFLSKFCSSERQIWTAGEEGAKV